MKKQQSGFTLIELVMVIVILGILAATALPKFIDLQSDAQASAIKGMAGGLGSQGAINYAGCSVVGHDATDPKCSTVNACGDVDDIMAGFDSNFGISTHGTKTPTSSTTDGTTFYCIVTRDWNGDSDTDDTNESYEFAAVAAGNG